MLTGSLPRAAASQARKRADSLCAAGRASRPTARVTVRGAADPLQQPTGPAAAAQAAAGLAAGVMGILAAVHPHSSALGRLAPEAGSSCKCALDLGLQDSLTRDTDLLRLSIGASLAQATHTHTHTHIHTHTHTHTHTHSVHACRACCVCLAACCVCCAQPAVSVPILLTQWGLLAAIRSWKKQCCKACTLPPQPLASMWVPCTSCT